MEILKDESRSLTTNQKLTLASSTAGFGLENMDVMFLSFALTSIIADLHISAGAAGFISSVTNLGMLLGGIFFGILADKYGRVKIFSHTVLIFAVATAAMYFANNIYLVFLFRFIAGIGAGGEYGAGVTLIAENFRHGKIAKWTSIAAIGGQIGAIVAALVAAWVLPNFGWHALFLVGLVPIIFAYFVRRNLKETPEFESEMQSTDAQPKVSIKELFATPKLAYQTLALIVMVIVQISGYFGLMNWLPSIMQKQLGLSVSGSSTWMIVTIIGMSLGMLTFGTIMDFFGPRRAFGIFLFVAAISVYAIIFAFNAWTLLLASTVVGFFSNGMYGGYGAIISRLYPTKIRATANNMIMSVGRAIGGFSPMVIGMMMEHYSLTVVMASLSVLYLISLVTMLSIPALKTFHEDIVK
ncbi:MFS transporter [Lactobacillus sp. Sy-1]|uniref:MFS transporter n=1 Tax=Lactobacillus sp. Sy-1 TaxID=2109645 RepID=UPI001C57F512|nr:MFS transporter [Lactobacillus sp. Sy-1]MBW1604961.1 MFS transporter [Lactobacillus sp. Sy-1]